jgi:hypothetical protein
MSGIDATIAATSRTTTKLEPTRTESNKTLRRSGPAARHAATRRDRGWRRPVTVGTHGVQMGHR